MFRLEKRILWLIGKYAPARSSRSSRSRTPTKEVADVIPHSSPSSSPSSSPETAKHSRQPTRPLSHSKLATEDDLSDISSLHVSTTASSVAESTEAGGGDHTKSSSSSSSSSSKPRSLSGSGSKLPKKERKTTLWNPTVGSHEQISHHEEVWIAPFVFLPIAYAD
jgi:hypothetical protein